MMDKLNIKQVRAIRDQLPPEAFSTAPGKLIPITLHLMIVITSIVIIKDAVPIFYPILSVLIGHSLACLSLYTHELSHGTIVRNRKVRYVLEVLLWAPNLIPATMWCRIHNQIHHSNANTPDDPDRRFLLSEKSIATRWYSRLFYPSKEGIVWNPLIFFGFVPYITKNIVSVFYPKQSKPVFVPRKIEFTLKQRLSIVFELIIIFGIQLAIFVFLQGNILSFIFASPAAILVSSAVVMTYIFTNHFVNPINVENDPLANTTSVIVPKVFDHLHTNFSYHTEHHFFPSMNSDYYPALSKILQQEFPSRYNRYPIGIVWQKLMQLDEFIKPGSNNK